MLQNLPIMLFGISLIFCLLCLFLCFLDMDCADISYFKLCNFAENNHDRNEINLDLQKHLLLFAYKICTFLYCLLGILLDMYLHIWGVLIIIIHPKILIHSYIVCS